MYKMIFTDLDGTLLNDSEQISPYSEQILKRASQQATVVLASARGIYRIRDYTAQIGTDNARHFTIAYNGSYVIRNDGTEIINAPISSLSPLRKLIMDNLDLRWILYSDKERVFLKTAEQINDFLDNNVIYKIVVTNSPEATYKMRSSLDPLFGQLYEISASSPLRIEFVEKGYTKMMAIRQLADICGVRQSEIMAFGDAENDQDMIEYAGLGVAVGNADQRLKDAADRVTDTNENDGVARILAEYFQ